MDSIRNGIHSARQCFVGQIRILHMYGSFQAFRVCCRYVQRSITPFKRTLPCTYQFFKLSIVLQKAGGIQSECRSILHKQIGQPTYHHHGKYSTIRKLTDTIFQIFSILRRFTANRRLKVCPHTRLKSKMQWLQACFLKTGIQQMIMQPPLNRKLEITAFHQIISQ